MKRKCLQCGCDLPDSVRGLFCDDECEEKFTEQYENNELHKVSSPSIREE